MGVSEALNFSDEELKELSEGERMAYNELKSRISNELKDDMKNDANLFIRFLRARDFNVDLAENMLRNHLAWRKAYQIENLLATFIPDEVAIKYIPLSLLGFDKEGSPVIYIAFGDMDSKGLLKSCKKTVITKTIVKYLEEFILLLKKQSEKYHKPIQQWTWILNFENYSFANATHKPTLELLIQIFSIYEANYPERLKSAYVVNASIYFTIAFQIIKPLLSGATLRKLTIYGKNDVWKNVLLQSIDADMLPAFLGGNRTDPDGNPMCQSFLRQGGLVPPEYYMTASSKRLKEVPGVKKITVSRMSKTTLCLDVSKPGSLIEWEFETQCRDIGFGLFFKQKNNSENVELIPKQRIDTQFNSETGMFKCDKPGTYILTFDNSYSWIHTKEIYCKADVVPPQVTISTAA